jgi:magnesium-transporting ATPase (P-type)
LFEAGTTVATGAVVSAVTAVGATVMTVVGAGVIAAEHPAIRPNKRAAIIISDIFFIFSSPQVIIKFILAYIEKQNFINILLSYFHQG